MSAIETAAPQARRKGGRREDLPIFLDTAAPRVQRLEPSHVALAIVLATVAMLFAGFASAMMIHRASPGWIAVPVPPLLVPSLVALVLSSLGLEIARRVGTGLAVTIAIAFGLAFLLMQWDNFRWLGEQGFGIGSSSFSGFFTMLAAVHAAHVLGGAIALGSVWTAPPGRAARRLGFASVYWHFVGAVWLVMLVFLFAKGHGS